ncbi:tyrosine-protein kinase HTK16-like [Octopus vulgaris]|uniref:Tyrosine-protein kinase n=1 Tax=Octopus vulgaris TaxID=6645 RepID=A0AA36BMI5_OCTVU|nr:tyrosine-protein kinase HTK16-like [Octopus vulgaris]
MEKFVNSLDVSKSSNKTSLSIDEQLIQDRSENKTADDVVAYYHENLCREEAETLLLNMDRKNKTNGRFLLRESRIKQNDKVISMLQDGKVYHFHVAHKFDNCFQIDCGPITQGIDRLIKIHQHKPAGLPCCLTSFVPGKPPPAALRCQGPTNLLHKAVQDQNTKLCAKILNSKECPDINTRNIDGDTPLHIACKIGNSNIVKLFLKYKVNLSVKNQDHCTPLQVACQANQPEIISDLLQIAKYDPHERCVVSGLYPLHEVAQKGYHKCVQLFLQNLSPAFPRTQEGLTPLDLAIEGKHNKCIKLFEKNVPPQALTKREHWLHPELERQGAAILLKRGATTPGLFLIRRSKWHEGWYVMSIYFGHVFHFEIQNCEYNGKEMYYIDNGPYMYSLQLLVHHYNMRSDGLPCLLKHGLSVEGDIYEIPRLNKNLLRLKSEDLEVPVQRTRTSVPLRVPPPVPPPVPPTSQPEHTETNFHFIDFRDIKKGGLLGLGEFGEVVKGTLTIHDGKKSKKITVALKTFNNNVVNSTSDFCREAKIMMNLDHICITKLIGLCQMPLMLVEEFVPKGSMLDFLLDYPSKVDAKVELILWASQIAFGMVYLESKKMVHRDLAARNILLESKKQIKISDFGLSRAVGENQYYRATTGGKWPIKWYSPESVKYGHFSHASDVWSFGITLWEMFTYGDVPYHDMKGIEVMKFLENNNRLSQPKKCPNAVYKIMGCCWEMESKARPTFTKLQEFFTNFGNQM